MSNTKKTEDYLDDFFNEISTGITTSNESAADFAKRIQDTVQESLERSGYKDLGDFINQGVDTAVRYMGPKAQTSGFEKPEKVVDGFTYVQNELAMIRYDMRRRGAFRDGHQEALRTYYGQIEATKKNFQMLQDVIRKDLKKRKKNQSRRDRFAEGYNQALADLLRILEDAKKYMMQRVRNDMMTSKS